MIGPLSGPVVLDLWSAAGFMARDRPRTTFLEVLEKGGSDTSASWVSTGNRKEILVRTKLSNSVIESSLAPEYGYLVRRQLTTTMRDGKPAYNFLREIDEFKEHAPGLFFPTKSRATYYQHGSDVRDALNSSTFVFKDVEINRPVDADLFRLQIPAGMSVFDKFKRIGYVMGADGNPDSRQPILKVGGQ
jgi:hypothetical protein